MRYLRTYGDRLLYGLVVLAALLPRLWQIGHFITPDETLFLDYARQFLRGLANGDLTLTFGLGYPGVPVVWANSLGLLALFILSRLGLAPMFPPAWRWSHSWLAWTSSPCLTTWLPVQERWCW